VFILIAPLHVGVPLINKPLPVQFVNTLRGGRVDEEVDDGVRKAEGDPRSSEHSS
jgi:hypothetical protein